MNLVYFDDEDHDNDIECNIVMILVRNAVGIRGSSYTVKFFYDI